MMTETLLDADRHAAKVLTRLQREGQSVKYGAYLTLMARGGYTMADANLAFARSGCSTRPNQTIDFGRLGQRSGQFWEDLRLELQVSEFARIYSAEYTAIAETDRMANEQRTTD